MQPKTKKLIVCAALLMFFALTGFSQDRVISGKVQTKNKIGISTALVQTSNSKRQVSADNEGNFTINVKAEDKAITISSLGFVTERFSLSSKTTPDYILQEDTKILGDVVVTAYGIKKEAKRIGYAVQELKGDDLTKARDPNPINSLAG